MSTTSHIHTKPIALSSIFVPSRLQHPKTAYLIGILPGEGIGPEIISISLALLSVVERARPLSFELRYGGKIGKDAIAEYGQALSPEVITFCQRLFDDGGALFCGPGGERFVYDLRKHFDLFCKLAPIQPMPALQGTGPLSPATTENVDLLVVRENTGGLYQGRYGIDETQGELRAWQHFDYRESQVARILDTAAALAQHRQGTLCVVTKPGGAPSISRLWEEKAEAVCADRGVELCTLEVDNACYQIIASACSFDVIVTPNMFGDVIADNAALLLGSRGMSYSANYSAQGHAVYQTGHGAAHDLAGTDHANPIGQILSLAMLLEQSFGLVDIAGEIRQAVDDTLASGWRTADIASPGCRTVGGRMLGEKIAVRLYERLATGARLEESSLT